MHNKHHKLTFPLYLLLSKCLCKVNANLTLLSDWVLHVLVSNFIPNIIALNNIDNHDATFGHLLFVEFVSLHSIIVAIESSGAHVPNI